MNSLIPLEEVKHLHEHISSHCPMISGRNCSNVMWNEESYPSLADDRNEKDRSSNSWNSVSVNTPKEIERITKTSVSLASLNSNESKENIQNSFNTQSTVSEMHLFSNSADRFSGNISQNHVLMTDSSETEKRHTIPAVQNETSTLNQSAFAPQVASIETSNLFATTTEASDTLVASSSMPNPSATLSVPIHSANINSGGAGPTYSQLGIITERPKRPEYALKQERLETFTKWPRDHHLSEDDLAEAGFYYADYGDCDRCFNCGIGLRNWEDEDDVWIEHARWFSRCTYVRGKLGQIVIDMVQDLCKQFEQISMKMVTDKLGDPLVLNSGESSLERDPAVNTMDEYCYGEKYPL
ncbi:Death-associated inhibitor of apoptosis 1 [Bulinus truncatus]|nr:Death-associated inhibitor of apoptosis 1 [Bulinus truncatus]